VAIGAARLAFVAADGSLWELTNGTEVKVASPSGYTASRPAFSLDGHWLAFMETPNRPTGSASQPQLWLAASNGRQAHELPAALDAEFLAWSPSGASLLVTTAGAAGPSEVMVVTTDGRARSLASGLVTSASWSPDGAEVAMSVTNHSAAGFTSVVQTVPLGGGLPTVWRTSTQDVLEVAGWWTNWGIVYWDDPSGSSSIAADGLALDVLSGAAQTPRPVANMLVRPDWLGSNDAGAATVVQGGGRVEWQDKTVQACSPYSCRAIPVPSGSVSVDPAMSHSGDIAFVEGKASQSYSSDPAQVASWETGHTLWVSAKGAAPVEVNGGQSACAPTWSPDSRRLMFVRGNGLWVVASGGGRASEVVSGLGAPADYYGQRQWLYQFAWAAS
jgi:dipeptidyl aminopeptidase/acylaminoacyl peptidase